MQATAPHRRALPWAGATLAGAALAAVVVIWLEGALAPGAGWAWLLITAALGGVGVDLARRRHGQGSACALKPQLRPLQVSCLAAQALGVLLWNAGPQPAFAAALPWLALPWQPLALVVAGALGLGVLSVFCDCRDEALQGGGGRATL